MIEICIEMKSTKKRTVHKGILGVQREVMKSQGFFDGRFVSRKMKSKKEYTRKTKHKNL